MIGKNSMMRHYLKNARLKPYIDMNTDLRKKLINSFWKNH